MKKALITGINGQDGSFLAELLLEKGYEVHGIIRRSSTFNTERIEHLYIESLIRDLHRDKKIQLHYGDMTDSTNLIRLVQQIQPDEIYNLAAQSHVKVSFDLPEYTAETDAVGTLRLLEAIRICGLTQKTKIYQASTSELYGKVQEVPQKETTPFYPRSPYGVAKIYAFWITKNYRESYGIYAVNGILFNHKSERRGETFVTRKITLSAARIKHGMQDKLYLGNLNALRDWGYAKDYVECMWLMLQQETPEDYVIATGVQYSVRYFCELAFKEVGIELEWQGENENEKGICKATGKILIEVDPNYYRPAEVESLLGDPTKARTQLGMKSESYIYRRISKNYDEARLRICKTTTYMLKDAKIYVAGSNGMVGSAIVRALKAKGYINLVVKSSKELDLKNQQAVRDFFSQEQPEYVFLAAAKVGGIHANNTYPATFIYDNIMIQSNVIQAAYDFNVKKLLFLGSSCIYPKFAPQPIKEEYLLTGSLEPTNEAYAIAKIAGLKMCQFYKQQYGCNFISAMPTNLFGVNNNFNLENSHVLPALLRKFIEAKQNNKQEVTIWGSGTPMREFLFVDDLAEACLFLMENYNGIETVNIGTGEDVSIKELAETIMKIVGFEGSLIFDASKPDGAPRKLLDVSKINNLGWKHQTNLEEGIQKTLNWIQKNNFEMFT